MSTQLLEENAIMPLSPIGRDLMTNKISMVDLEDLVASSDIAELFGVKPGTVAMWKQREDSFPPALKIVGGREIFSRTDVEAWGRLTGRLAHKKGHIYDSKGYDVTQKKRR